MAKKLKRKSSRKESDYENYMLGDPLFDLLRSYHKGKGGLDDSEWISICKRDAEHMKAKKKKEINDRRNYGKV